MMRGQIPDSKPKNVKNVGETSKFDKIKGVAQTTKFEKINKNNKRCGSASQL